MYIENLHLSLTRNCTLECEHCLRGNRQHVSMDPLILDKIFQDILEVENLLITGGEPLIAIQSLEKLAEIIRNKMVKINNIFIITNGTVLSERIIKVLTDLNIYSHLELKVSSDIFHQIELTNKNLLELRDKNYKTLCETFDYVEEYGKEEHSNTKRLLTNKGRAQNITYERLEQINSMSKQIYIIDDTLYKVFPKTSELINNKIIGYITVDVYGNIVHYGLSFEEEDKDSYESGLNVMTLSFKEAIREYINNNYQEPEKQKVLK